MRGSLKNPKPKSQNLNPKSSSPNSWLHSKGRTGALSSEFSILVVWLARRASLSITVRNCVLLICRPGIHSQKVSALIYSIFTTHYIEDAWEERPLVFRSIKSCLLRGSSWLASVVCTDKLVPLLESNIASMSSSTTVMPVIYTFHQWEK